MRDSKLKNQKEKFRFNVLRKKGITLQFLIAEWHNKRVFKKDDSVTYEINLEGSCWNKVGQ